MILSSPNPIMLSLLSPMIQFLADPYTPLMDLSPPHWLGRLATAQMGEEIVNKWMIPQVEAWFEGLKKK